MEASRAPLLELEEISVRIGDVRALANLNAFVRKGERVAIVGPEHAGKTTVLHSIIGRCIPYTGAVRHNGNTITNQKPADRAHLGIATVARQSELFDSQSVLANLTIGRHRLMRGGFLRGMLYWVGGARREEVSHRIAVEEILAFLGLENIRNEKAGTLSQYDRRRVDIGRAMAMQAEILLIDEPMAELNPEEEAEITRILIALNEQKGMTIVMAARNLAPVANIAQRVMVLHQGRNIAEGSPEEIKGSEAVQRAYQEAVDAVRTLQTS